ncbi:LAETG motif-containing sortase-dependent surface protein [Embleya sp. NPDC005971]|uniref:LAETG motif-containing sortase-dependent surface protein n=1 Tax=unclassified Embleya TaxID=2699296 RepID=UPI0033F0D7A3
MKILGGTLLRIRLSPARKAALFTTASLTLIGASAISTAAADTRDQLVEITAPASVDLELGTSTTLTVTLDVKPDKPGATTTPNVYALFKSGVGVSVKSLKLVLPAPCLPAPEDSFSCRWDSLPVGQTKLALKVTSVATNPSVSHEVINVMAGGAGFADTKSIDVVHQEPVDFAVLDKDARSTRKPGDTFAVPMGFQNVRERTLTDVSLISESDYGLEPAKKYANCRYGLAYGTRNLVVCDFKGPVKAGESFGLAEPYPYKVSPDVPVFGAQAYYRFVQTADVTKSLRGADIQWSPGAGDALKLASTTTQAPDRRASSGSFNVLLGEDQPQSTTSTPPISVVASPGIEVPVRVSVKNDGPRVLNSFDTGGPGSVAGIAFPKGVRVAAVPKECSHESLAADQDALRPLKAAGADVYGCEITGGELWKVGTTRDFTFKVELAKGLTDAKGGIVTVAAKVPLVDMVFTAKEGATSGGSGSTGGAATTAGAGSTGGGNGTELAETGSDSSSTTLIVGGAAALFVLGGGVFFVARRRKGAGLVA